jgi:hypothetical protein
MRSKLKRIIRYLIPYAIFTAIFIAIASGVAVMKYQQRLDFYKCVECSPNDLLPFLDPPLPDNIFNVHTAKSPAIDSAIIFLVKFKIGSDQFNTHLKSTNNSIVLLEDYSSEDDYRNDYRLLPKWFDTKISTGKSGFWGSSVILIDTTDAKNFTVYMKGHYSSFGVK